MEALDLVGDDIFCFMNYEGDVVWRLWVKFYLNVRIKKLGIIISYLISYEKFFIFVIYERFNKKVLVIYFLYMKDFFNILKDLKGWRSVVDS